MVGLQACESEWNERQPEVFALSRQLSKHMCRDPLGNHRMDLAHWVNKTLHSMIYFSQRGVHTCFSLGQCRNLIGDCVRNLFPITTSLSSRLKLRRGTLPFLLPITLEVHLSKGQFLNSMISSDSTVGFSKIPRFWCGSWSESQGWPSCSCFITLLVWHLEESYFLVSRPWREWRDTWSKDRCTNILIWRGRLPSRLKPSWARDCKDSRRSACTTWSCWPGSSDSSRENYRGCSKPRFL